jgi:2-polyprenyl-3-methyl-5-hydroxy-6-metoxy-1,4-benzoquinol methylase
MKILFAHVAHSVGVSNWYQEIANNAPANLHVDCFCVTLSPPGPRLDWVDLDRRWRQKERSLLEMYTRLREIAVDYDVLLLYNGANVHPEFLQYLTTFNVYCCFDDPESSDELSAPVAHAFDAVFYGNISSRFQYEHWGCKKIAWLPIFTAPSDLPNREAGELLLSAPRDEDICLIGEKNLFRNRRLEMLSTAFPNAKCFGRGWPNGQIDSSAMQSLYRQAKIGWNIHNSTGPINRRLFTLPAFGILQICDNKTGLSQIFRLGEEVIGFDSIPEAIELTEFYLKNEDERCRIAANGFNRYWLDYHTIAIWNRIRMQIEEWSADQLVLRKPLKFPTRTALDIARPYSHTVSTKTSSVLRKITKVAQIFKRQKIDPILTLDERVYLGEKVPPYFENSEMKGVNLAKERLANGDPFEWPNIVALNWAATTLIRKAQKIVEIGSGTGPFAELASFDIRREIHCFEEDDFARGWAEKNRGYANVKYQKLFKNQSAIDYDLLVSLDVFEHVNNMRGFLDFCKSLAPRAIFSTPNRTVVRGIHDIGPPAYPPHVREFTPGEFYWILKQYYKSVSLYYMPNVYVPWLEPMSILTNGTPIIAECTGPICS